MHAPHADLAAFALEFGTRPTRIFDTQLAAGFVGLGSGLAYDRLVTELVGIEVGAHESFSDWSRRPLSANQLRYAAEDVLHLEPMVEELLRRLDERDRRAWALAEMAKRFAPERLTTDPREAWRKVSRRNKLNGAGLATLRELAAWREQRARDRDVPVARVVKDVTLIEMSRRRPSSARELARIRGVDGTVRERDRHDLAAVIREADGLPPLKEHSAPPMSRHTRKRIAVSKGLATALLRALCEDADIAPELVGTAPDVEELIAWVDMRDSHDVCQSDQDSTPALLEGWRRDFGQPVVDLIEGRIQVHLGGEPPYLRTSSRS